MAHGYLHLSDGNTTESVPVLRLPKEQPIDNESKELIYLSTRLVEKTRLEDARILDEYDKKCKNTKEYKALQEAKARIDKKYEKKIESITNKLYKDDNGKPRVENRVNKYDYYTKVIDAFEKVGGDEINYRVAVANRQAIKDKLFMSVTNTNQYEMYQKLQKIKAAKQSELEPYEHDFEVAANRRKRGPVREALRRSELMELSDRIMELNQKCYEYDAYEASLEEEFTEGNSRKELSSLRDSFHKITSKDYDAILAAAERNELKDRWDKMEQEAYDNLENCDDEQDKEDLQKTNALCDNLSDKRELRRRLADMGCTAENAQDLINKVDSSVNAMSTKIQSGALPISVLDARSYDPSSYDVTIEKVKPGTKVHNKLENSDYVTDDDRCFVVTGTAGEQWPVNGDKLKSKYGLDPDSVKDGEPTTAHVNGGNDGIWAVPVTGSHKIETSWGDVLETNAAGVEHGDGDYIVSNSPDFSDTWVVNGAVFGNTYKESEDNEFVGKAFSKVSESSQSDDPDDLLVDDLVASAANSKYEMFKDKDGNTCRRDKSTGATTVWVEGYDRVRRGKVEHVKSYWKVLHK